MNILLLLFVIYYLLFIIYLTVDRFGVSLYHYFVAVRKVKNESPRVGRKGNPPVQRAGKSWIILFWLGFFILFLGLFILNRESIRSSIDAIRNDRTVVENPREETPAQEPAGSTVRVAPPAATPPAQEQTSPQPAAQAVPQTVTRTPPAVPPAPAPAPAAQPSAAPAAPAANSPAASSPAANAPAQPAAQPATGTQTSQAETRERVLYFTEVDRGGAILRIRVNRKIPVSDSPMTDAIQALIAGPNADERSRGLMSLIPPGTRILSAQVRGSTAYISFSEDFQYNSYGVEGYAGQLRQIIYTATEFSNIKDVQVLVDGRRVDYLGEGIWIGSPLSREMFP